MTTRPTPIRLDGRGPYETQVAVGCLGLGLPGAELPVRLLMVLEGGIELRIPLSDLAAYKLLRQCSEFYKVWHANQDTPPDLADREED